MMISPSGFPLIKRNAFIFLVLLGVGATAVVAIRRLVADAQLDRLTAQHKMNEARSRLNQANADMRDRKSYAAEYDELLKRNIIGNDRRLDWMKGLENIRSRNLVIDFRYTISPQQPYSPPFPLDSGSFDLHLSPMSIRLDLLHEGQLLEFLEALSTETNGWFILHHCSIERSRIAPATAPDSFPPQTGGDIVVHAGLPNLHAECSGGWLTMKNRIPP